MPLVREADHTFAQISADNARSWELFLKNGFGIVAAAVDPGDQQARFILQKPADGFNFDIAPAADDVDPMGDFPAIVRLTQREGLIGRIDDEVSAKRPASRFLRQRGAFGPAAARGRGKRITAVCPVNSCLSFQPAHST